MSLLNATCAAQSVGVGNQLVTLLLSTLISNYCAISSKTLWPEDYGEKIIRNQRRGFYYGARLEEYDFIVVGAGSAGSIVASRLSENPNWKVLLLEAGGNPPVESEIPFLLFSMQHTENDWQYYTEPDGRACMAMKENKCHWPRGKLLGGTGAINVMLYLPGVPQDYENWKELGNPTWGWKDVEPYFKKVEDLLDEGFQTKDVSQCGRLVLNQFDNQTTEFENIIINGARELNYNYIDDYPKNNYLGYSNVFGTTYKGRRYSTAKTYLVPAKNRKNLHIIKYAHVKKINFDNKNRVSSIDFVYNSKVHFTAKVKREVVLSAGVFGSPHTLMLSGIGPENNLKKFNIPVIQNLPVGENLQDHPMVPVFYQLNKSTAKPVTDTETVDDVYNYLMGRRSSLSELEGMKIVGFINTTHGQNGLYPDIEYHHLVYKNQDPDFPDYVETLRYKEEIAESLLKANEEADLLVFYVVLLQPTSAGKIELASRKYNDKPKIYPNYFEHEKDLNTLIRGIRYVENMGKTRSFKEHEAKLVKINIPECNNNYKFQSHDYWKCYIKYLGFTQYHQAGTVKMGSGSDGVLDGRLRVKGVKGVRVADASVMPKIISANTNAATTMIAERASDFIKEEWKNQDDVETCKRE